MLPDHVIGFPRSPYFSARRFGHCRLIYEVWMSFSAESLADNNNVEQPLIPALDIVQGLLNKSRIRRLLLRFACMHLAKTIVDYKIVAATDRIRRSTYRV
jgi:hypothetical protein